MIYLFGNILQLLWFIGEKEDFGGGIVINQCVLIFAIHFLLTQNLNIFAHRAFALIFMLRSFCFKFEDMEQVADGS